MHLKHEPKVHTYARTKRQRLSSPMHKVLSVSLTVLLIGGVGVLGYSIARPIMQFQKEENSTLVLETKETNPSDAAAQEFVAATEIPTAAEPEQTHPKPASFPVYLPENAWQNRDALTQAIAQAKQDVPEADAVVVTMKAPGGVLCYRTSVPLGETCGAAQGSLTASEIAEIVAQYDLTAIARCSLLQDNLAPDGDPQAGYVTMDGSRWLDNKKENGGKPWIDPQSETAQQYLSDLIGEMTSAGFSEIWCCDVIFPPFRESDYTYLAPWVQSSERSDVLTALLERLAMTARDVPVYLETEAQRLMDGTEEAYTADDKNIAGLIVRCDDLSETAEAACRMVQQKTPALGIYLAAGTRENKTEIREKISEQCGGQLQGFAVFET